MGAEYISIELDPDAFGPTEIYGIERRCHNPECKDVSQWPILPGDATPPRFLARARSKGGCPYCLATAAEKMVSYAPLWTTPAGPRYEDQHQRWEEEERQRALRKAVENAPNVTRLPKRAA